MATEIEMEFITPPQLAKRWGVAVEKIWQLIDNGSLVAINFATDPNGQKPRYRITLEEVSRFLEARSTKPPAPIRIPKKAKTHRKDVRRKSKGVR